MEEDGRIPEAAIGYVLAGGLVVSTVVTVVGILLYFAQSGTFSFDFSSQWQVSGPNFFAYALGVIDSASSFEVPTGMMALGVILLMLTSYTRVFATVLYFAFAKNAKYTVISFVVLTVLTLTLLIH